jgi:GT2 family glycosyltransferase
MYDIVTSIVTFKNDKDILKNTIDSFLRTDLKSHLYVIDNSPTDDLKNVCACRNVEYIFTNDNLGFGAGHNIALGKSIGESKYHLVLNPDIFFEPGILEKLFNYMEENQEVGLVMPKICYTDGSTQYLCKLLPTPIDLILRRFNLKILRAIFKKRLQNYELRFTGYGKIMDVPHLSGCFMFIRTEALSRVGLFDERFFMYLEDVDLSRRIHKCYRTMYYPEVSVFHEYEKGSYKNSKLLIYHLWSAVRYFNKWGYFFDKERREINKKVMEKLNAL